MEQKLSVRLLDCAPVNVPCLVAVSHSETRHSPLNFQEDIVHIFARVTNTKKVVIYF